MRKYNRSKTYLLPLLSELLDLDMRFMKYLLNTYMFHENDEYKDCFCILHEFSFKNPEFTSYEHRLTNNSLFVKAIDIGNKVLYIFKFPEEYLLEYYLFEQGRYSEFGDDAKKLILRFWAEAERGNPSVVKFLIKLKQILYKDEKLRLIIQKELNVTLDEESELGEVINIEEETFKLDES